MHRTRAFRRKQLKKKKHRFEKIALQTMFSISRKQGEVDPVAVQHWVVREATTPKTPCQCCRNPRRSVLYKSKDKLTMQEKRDQLTQMEVWQSLADCT